MNKLEKIKYFLNKYAAAILVAAVLFYIIVFFGISCWKYNNFQYNSLDLAIFNQVFYNTSHGRLFQSSIHESTYLGDHFAPIILILSLFYSFFRSPLTLLFLQTLILALCVWPIYLIAKRVIAGKIWPLIIGLMWLANPLTQNANLFEFHLLPFAVFSLLWVFYFYLRKKWRLFFLFVFLSLLVREDVSLAVGGFGLLAVIDSLKLDIKNWKLKIKNFKQLIIGIAVCALAAVWLIVSLKIISHFAPDGSYKFLYYYSWLGNSPAEIFINIFKHPFRVLNHFVSIRNLEMVLGLLLPFCFLPLWSRKYLILLLGPLSQLMIGAPGGSSLILQSHYNLLLLPALIISTIYALKRFLNEPIGQNSRFEIIRILSKEKGFLLTVFFAGIIFSNLGLGPLGKGIYKTIKAPQDLARVKIKKNFVQQIPPHTSVAATYEFLNNLSSRRNVYSMHYVFIGKKQYSDIDYKLPPDTEYLLIDFNDFFLYQIQFPNISVYNDFFNSADDKMRELLENYRLIKIFDDYALFKLTKSRQISPLYRLVKKEPEHKQSVDLRGKIKFIGWEKTMTALSPPFRQDDGKPLKRIEELIPLSLFWQTQENLAAADIEEPVDNYQLKLLIANDQNRIVYKKFYPLGYGIFPTSEWPVGEIVQINYWFYIPKKFIAANNILQFELAAIDGYMKLNSWRTAELEYNEQVLKPVIVIGKIKDLR